MNLRPQRKIKAEFSMSSMTDIIFLLLIFFIIASTFISPNAIDVNLPAKTSHRETPTPIAVAVTKDNTYYVNNEPAVLNDLPLAIEKELKGMNKEDVAIAIFGDIEASYEAVFNVIKIGKAMDIKVILATDNEK